MKEYLIYASPLPSRILAVFYFNITNMGEILEDYPNPPEVLKNFWKFLREPLETYSGLGGYLREKEVALGEVLAAIVTRSLSELLEKYKEKLGVAVDIIRIVERYEIRGKEDNYKRNCKIIANLLLFF